jgi:hypothetical protein
MEFWFYNLKNEAKRPIFSIFVFLQKIYKVSEGYIDQQKLQYQSFYGSSLAEC